MQEGEEEAVADEEDEEGLAVERATDHSVDMLISSLLSTLVLPIRIKKEASNVSNTLSAPFANLYFSGSGGDTVKLHSNYIPVTYTTKEMVHQYVIDIKPDASENRFVRNKVVRKVVGDLQLIKESYIYDSGNILYTGSAGHALLGEVCCGDFNGISSSSFFAKRLNCLSSSTFWGENTLMHSSFTLPFWKQPELTLSSVILFGSSNRQKVGNSY